MLSFLAGARRSSTALIPDTADGTLVHRALGGDTDAYEQLVRTHWRAAYAVALAGTQEHADAEDLCQNAFVQCYDHLSECRQPERFRAWLLQTVRNRAHNHREWRRVREAVPLDDALAESASRSPSRETERAQLRGALLKALGTLSSVRREVVLLHDLEGFAHKEIAASLGISELMARRHLSDARRLLRERLAAHAPDQHEGLPT